MGLSDDNWRLAWLSGANRSLIGAKQGLSRANWGLAVLIGVSGLSGANWG